MEISGILRYNWREKHRIITLVNTLISRFHGLKSLHDENKWLRRSGRSTHFFSKRILDQRTRTIILLNIFRATMKEKIYDI